MATNKEAFQPPEARDDWALTVPTPVEPGIYEGAEILAVTLRVTETDAREWLLWEFQLSDGRAITGGTSFSISVRSKAYAWLAAIMGKQALAAGATVTTADLLGKRVTVLVEADADEIGSHVAAVLPSRKPESPAIEELMDELPS